jgi:cytochrome c-type biogenesis protein CcmH
MSASFESSNFKSTFGNSSRFKSSRFTSSIVKASIAASLLLISVAPAVAREAVPEASDPALEARMIHVTSELRCLVCQNQTIADSHADLAVDLRNQVREQLRAGRSDAEIVDYMTARYGDFVLYRPPFKPITVLLWLGPALMLGGGLIVLALVLRRRSRLPQDAFEPDDDDALAASHGA